MPDIQYNGRVYDPSTGFHDYGARMYWPEIGRFISVDPAGTHLENPASLNRYAYVLNNPYKYVDPDGREVRVQWHEAWSGTGQYHTFIRIVPENQARYATDSRFQKDAEGKLFATLGAGPEGGRLVSDRNRPRDSQPHTGGIVVSTPANARNEDEFIERLFRLEWNYQDDLDYDLFAAPEGQRKWWVADDGYNSNSYTAGLLQASDADVPAPSVRVPGYDRPVPRKEFSPHEN